MRSIKDQIPVDRQLWYAVNCKYRCERQVTEDLLSMGIEAYIPILQKVRQYASRTKSDIDPFACLCED